MRLHLVRLVAERELRERLRTRSFRISTALTLVFIIGIVVVPAVIDDDKPSTIDVVAAGELTAPARQILTLAAVAADARVDITDAASPAEAEAAVKAGDADLAVVDGRELVTDEPLDDIGATSRFVAIAREGLRLLNGLAAVGLGPDAAQAVLNAPPVSLRSLVKPSADADRGQGLAFTGGLLLYIFISVYGVWVLYGVAEEKSSRVVEVLLAVLRPTELLTGKVVGIGLLALGQGLLSVAVAIAAAAASGSSLLDGNGLWEILVILPWFLIGYAFYSSLYGAAGSLVARQEDVQNAATPVVLPLLAGYFVAITAAAEPESTLVRVFSFLPPTSPLVMPARSAVTDVPGWEMVVAFALAIAGIVVAVRIAGTIYGRAILRTSRRVSLKEVLRG